MTQTRSFKTVIHKPGPPTPATMKRAKEAKLRERERAEMDLPDSPADHLTVTEEDLLSYNPAKGQREKSASDGEVTELEPPEALEAPEEESPIYNRADLDGMNKDEVEEIASGMDLDVTHGEDPSKPPRKEDLVRAILEAQGS